MRLTHIKRALILTGIIAAVLSCNGVYAYSQELSVAQLAKSNEELIKENKRLNNMLGQYSILVNSLRSENERLKNSIEKTEIIEASEDRKYIGKFTLTYYCKETGCNICGGGGTTASGTIVTPYRSVAVDPSVIPLGTELYIDGIGYRIAEDTGGMVKGNKIDLNVTTHEEALTLGKKTGVNVWLVND